MFREARRKNKEISKEEIYFLLKKQRRGVLSVIGDDEYPYGVPINYTYDETTNKIYFHGSKVGHKNDAIRKNDKVCFTVYGNETIDEKEKWAPYMQSVIIFGRCKVIENEEEIINKVRKLASKYYPNQMLIEEEITKSIKALQMFEIKIEHISGKQVQEK